MAMVQEPVELGRARAAEGASAQSLASIDAQFRREALDAFNEADAAARLRREELTIAQDRNSRAVLTAPVSGVVQQLQVHTVGAVLRPADNLLVIVPDGSTLVVDAMVLNRGEGARSRSGGSISRRTALCGKTKACG